MSLFDESLKPAVTVRLDPWKGLCMVLLLFFPSALQQSHTTHKYYNMYNANSNRHSISVYNKDSRGFEDHMPSLFLLNSLVQQLDDLPLKDEK